jgi:DNA/RNA-binding domain of Phe-tRNA-synthetase-like protein
VQELPFEVGLQLDGWTLFWAHLEFEPGSEDRLATLRADVADRVREDRNLGTLSSEPTVAALRRLFKAAGCDPTRYRPSSEALLRRILKGAELPVIHPLVDMNNCLSALLGVPCCVMKEGSFAPPLSFRPGKEGESYESMRGPFNLEGKPLLTDTLGPLDAPITGSERAKVTADTIRAWLVAYLPNETLTAERAEQELERLVEAAPVARILTTAAS